MFVYHGSPNKKHYSNPCRHIRTRKRNGKNTLLFDQVSFHASPEYWIAITYTYTRNFFNLKKRKIYHNVEVDLYHNNKEVIIHGIESLEHSLEVLYGKGGYVATFPAQDFVNVEGLGDLECITSQVIKATLIEFISDPVTRLQELGIVFKFIDLSKEEYISRRNYVSC